MTDFSAPNCPCCADPQPRCIGALPDSHWFAGVRLDRPLRGGNLYRCNHCKFCFRYPVLEAPTYRQLYDNAATANWSGNATRMDWNLIERFILERFPGSARVLDFGCYTGGLLARLPPRLERYGIEINAAAAEIARQRSASRVWSSTDAVPADLRFDVIIAVDVIEHLPDPAELIERLLGLLAERGVLVITSGDANNRWWRRYGANWWYCFYPEHISFLSEAWLGYLSRHRGVSLHQCSVFRHAKLCFGARLLATLLMHCYGNFPGTYLRMTTWMRGLLGKHGGSSAPGNGVSADHLFAVLARGIYLP